MTLREWIKAEGLTRDKAAERLGITRRHLEALITRFKSPGFALSARIIDESRGRITIHDLLREPKDKRQTKVTRAQAA